MRPVPRNVLLVQPRFAPGSFWNYQATCELVGARYSAAPLGLITVAALLPAEWTARLVDRNIQELDDADLAWADLVMTGGMLPQQVDTRHVIARAHAHGKRVVIGGADVSSSPDAYPEADFVVLGEAEEVMPELVRALEAGAEGGVFRAQGFPDVTKSPVPRFDLLALEHYLHVGVQLSRGCPYRCEFCNVIELNGQRPRLKTSAQMLRELEVLHGLGYRGHVDFVDDNLIGDRKHIKPFLADLAAWTQAHGFPFEYTTEASLNLADDPELLALMKRANFFGIFVGIETPDPELLQKAGKRQNLGHVIAQSLQRIYAAGLFVNAGFIVGFDSERARVAAAMVDTIEAASIPVCMVGLLFALPNTQLARRLSAEGRLQEQRPGEADADQCTSGLNFRTLRPRHEVLEDYREVCARLYAPAAFFGRVRRLVRQLDTSGHRVRLPPRRVLRDLRSLGRILWRSGVRDAEVRGPFWHMLLDCLAHNPRAARTAVSMAALYLHYGPWARALTQALGAQVARAEHEARAAAG